MEDQSEDQLGQQASSENNGFTVSLELRRAFEKLVEDKEQLRKQNEGQRQMTRKKEAEIDILKAELTKAHHKIMKLKRTQEGHLIKMRDQYNTTLEQIRQKIKKYKKKSKHCCDNVLDICHKPIELPYVAEPTLNSVRSMEDLMKNGIQSRSSLIDETIKGSYKHAQHHEDHPRASKRKETSTSVSDSPTDFSRDIENNEGMGENSNEVKRLKFALPSSSGQLPTKYCEDSCSAETSISYQKRVFICDTCKESFNNCCELNLHEETHFE